MFPKDAVVKLLGEYDLGNMTMATVCSHSSLQIFHGARMEGFKTLGIAVRERMRYYDAFPLARPDEFLMVGSYGEIPDLVDELLARNVVLIPHGSFVEYLGAENFANLGLPTFGNRAVLEWESDRDRQREWLEAAGISMPTKIDDPKDIDRPVLVKYHGAKGGRGFFIAKDYADFKLGIDWTKKYTIQEYILGTRYYIHYFYSPIKDSGYTLSRGSLEVLSMDRRDESNIDEMYKLGSQEELKKHGIFPSFVVTGNVPVVLRESLLPKVFDMGEKVVEKSLELFGGMIGPFCLETIVTDQLEFKVFEISGRIVAGTNPFIGGSPYSEFIEPGMSTGRRIAREIKNARDLGLLDMVLS
ncbi:MAG: formate--phosphoribosylaminoimidazolecarboxamide ligase [Thermoplasmata archaeon]|nr:formate--phosphoribosylaminoimidazolecarboxamide ligase [Thermoplasmata archaeon]